MQKEYQKLMRRCIKLAKKGEGKVSPNPLVGAVIFDDNFKIVSEGAHEYYGGNHAERNAILNAKEDLKGKSIIVNLEPCPHYGKTPPCSDLIIEKGIKRVILGMVDPNPIVSGRGIKKLQNAGIEVITGILEDECKELNKFFIKNQLKELPYITIKTATTLDGKIGAKTGDSKWITDEYSRNYVQKLRNKYDAVLTSSATVIKDNPAMTVRLKNGRNPVRIILDTNLSSSKESKIYEENGARVIIITGEHISDKKIKEHARHNIEYIKCPLKNGHIDLNYAQKLLFKEGIMSILIECGGILNNALIREEIADNLIQFISPKILGDKDGIAFVEGFEREKISQCNNLVITSTKRLKRDIIVYSSFLY
ncbi:MAG: bifunctional diaminohydroxyphosphoribosylaminopyrimidine deaminase/5-amino-6-(5-phosphoribosylamino)uracil reductase RibD [Candidatus Gastranaerophilales bacterium]|nr:bifunctional diaminohydroxyphosphoribosylaminopyrimidine deaminase/5-amino-6-(5-phosphoribosylamino)uracil reductase RibD [Candidatus Gastranaerophilales bacterium]